MELHRIVLCCRDKDMELQKQKELAREQAAQAEKALEEFKQQVEKNQNQIYADMKHQVIIINNDYSISAVLNIVQQGHSKSTHTHALT